MPFVNIRIVKEVLEPNLLEKKEKISMDVAQAIAKHAGIDAEKVWIVIDEVPGGEFYVGGKPVADPGAGG